MTFTDQLGTTVEINKIPKRIVSAVPSQTELLYDLGLNAEVVGITKFCIHPNEWFKTKTRIGGTKNLAIEKIIEFQPDIIFANKEENTEEDIIALKKHFPVWTSNINDLSSAIEMIEQIGLITDTEITAKKIANEIVGQFEKYKISIYSNAIYLIWNDPIMTIGRDTFINEMLRLAGFNNLTSGQSRYPEITIEKLKAMNPEVLLLSSEPFPFKQENIDYYQSHLPNTKVLIVDGELFSWYGSRMQKSPLYFSELRSRIQNAS